MAGDLGASRSRIGDLERQVDNSGVLDGVRHSYYQVVFNDVKDDIQEVSNPIETIQEAKENLKTSKPYYPDENLYLIARLRCD